MDEDAFKFHISSETLDKGRHGKEFEYEFGKYLLFHLICQRENFKNFKMTREKNGTGKFDDFVYVYDSKDAKSKYCLIQLKQLTEENKKINYQDLTTNSKSCFGLPYYFDHYVESLQFLSNDRDFKDAELEELIFCTNIDMKDDLLCISKTEISNEGLFKNSGNLYKLSINELEKRREIFNKQFLSERKRLAMELAEYVLQNKVIDLQSIVSSCSFTLIKTYYDMLVDNVIDVGINKFKESFLDKELESKHKYLHLFRKEFFDSLFEYLENLEVKKEKKIKDFPTDKDDTDGIIEFLRNKKITLKGISRDKVIQNIAKELVLCIFMQKPLDLRSVVSNNKLLKEFRSIINEYVIETDTERFKKSFLKISSDKNDIHSLREYFLDSLKKNIDTERFKKYSLNENCNKSDVLSLRKHFFDGLNKFYDSFGNTGIKDLETQLHLCSSQTIDRNLAISLHEAFKDCEDDKEKFIKFLTSTKIKFKNFSDDNAQILNVFPSDEVDEIDIDNKITTFLRLLTFALNQGDYETLIKEHIRNNLFKIKDAESVIDGYFKYMTKWYHEGVSTVLHKYDSNLKYREWITEQNMLSKVMNSNILFQNEKMKLSDVCDKSEIVTSDLLIYNFTEGKMFRLGKENVNKIPSYYIDRIFTQSKRVTDHRLKKYLCSKDIIIISLDDRFDPINFQRLYSLSIELKDLEYCDETHLYYYTRKEFSSTYLKEFCDKYKDIPFNKVHWMTYLGTDIRHDSAYPPCYPRFEASYNTKLLISKRFIIISGEPGSGKTVLFQHLSNLIQNKNKPGLFWIIRISFNDCQEIIDKFSDLCSVENFIKFLSICENSENKYSRNILTYFLKNSRLILFFDGFDEITKSENREKVKQLLSFLKSTPIKQIWISTRPHYAEELEKVLEVVRFEIKDINENDQVNLVKELWKSDQSKAENLIKTFNNCIYNEERKFLGIPLHTYMLAISFEEQTKCTVPEGISLVKLYEYYFKKKFDIFFDTKIMQSRFKEEVTEYYEYQYQKFALEFSGVISSEDFLILKGKMPKYKYEDLLRIGLVYKNENAYQFVHRTFAEYLIADHFASYIETFYDKSDTKTLIKNILLDGKNEFILHVFDVKLVNKHENYQILRHVMNGEGKVVVDSEKESLNTLDFLGRNSFYYAFKYHQIRIISYLIEKNIDVNIEDFLAVCLRDFFKFYYDFKNGKNKEYTFLIEFLLEKENSLGNFTTTFIDEYLSLEKEIYFGHWNIAKKLITKFSKKVYNPSLLFLELSDAPEDFIDVYMKLLNVDESLLEYGIIIDGLLNLRLDILKNVVDKHRDFIMTIPINFNLINEKYIPCSRIFWHLREKNFLKYSELIKRNSENFITLFNFLFEAKGISSENFYKEFEEFYTTSYHRLCSNESKRPRTLIPESMNLYLERKRLDK